MLHLPGGSGLSPHPTQRYAALPELVPPRHPLTLWSYPKPMLSVRTPSVRPYFPCEPTDDQATPAMAKPAA